MLITLFFVCLFCLNTDKNDPHLPINIRMIPTIGYVPEHAKAGYVVSTLVTDDIDKGATHTYKVGLHRNHILGPSIETC